MFSLQLKSIEGKTMCVEAKKDRLVATENCNNSLFWRSLAQLFANIEVQVD